LLWYLQENPSKRRRIPLELLPAARCEKKEVTEEGIPKPVEAAMLPKNADLSILWRRDIFEYSNFWMNFHK